MDKKYKLSDVFKFDKRDVTTYMIRTLRLHEKFRDAFEYLMTRLPVQELMPLEKLIWDEGKNYHWAIMKTEEVILIFRQYRTHITVFFRTNQKDWLDNYKHGCFSYYSDLSKMNGEDNDKYVCNNFIDFNATINDLLKLLADGDVDAIWNKYVFKRPAHVEVKPIWNGSTEDVSLIDDFIFCCDELFEKHLEMFAKTDMLEKIKTLKVGNLLNDKYEILSISTSVKDGYYHNAGLELKGTNGKDSKSWQDVYSLTRWYLNDVFPELNLVE